MHFILLNIFLQLVQIFAIAKHPRGSPHREASPLGEERRAEIPEAGRLLEDPRLPRAKCGARGMAHLRRVHDQRVDPRSQRCRVVERRGGENLMLVVTLSEAKGL